MDPTSAQFLADHPVTREHEQEPPDPQARFLETQYWADHTGDELGAEVMSKVKAIKGYMNSLGYPDRWLQATLMYYGQSGPMGMLNSRGIRELGPQGQYKYLDVNHYRPIIKSLLAMQTVNPPTTRTKPINDDSANVRDASNYQNVLDYYAKELNALDKFVRVGESAANLDAGYMAVTWLAEAGETWGPDQKGFWSGQPQINFYSAWDTYYDVTKLDWRDVHDITLRSYRPKAWLANRFPGHRDEIMNQSASKISSDPFDSYRWQLQGYVGLNQFNDDIPIYEWFHERTEYKRDGYYAVFLQDGTCLFEGPLPYDQIPVERFVFDEDMNSLLGFGPSNLLIGPQQGVNVLHSSYLSNLMNFAMQYIWLPFGTKFNPELSGNGIAALEGPDGSAAPTGINFAKMPEGGFQYLQQLEQLMGDMVNVSQPSRGQVVGPEFSGKAAQGLIQQSQFNQGPLASRYADFVGKVYTQLLRVVKRYARNEKTLGIIGQNNGGTETFLSETLTNFDRVICEPGNPALTTPEGRTNMISLLMQYGGLPPDAAIKLLLENNWDGVIKGPQMRDVYLSQENEWLLAGNPVPVNALDDHPRHLEKHKELLNNADFRLAQPGSPEEQKFQAALQHCLQHQQFLSQLNAPPPQPSAAGSPGAPGQAPQDEAPQEPPAPNSEAPPA